MEVSHADKLGVLWWQWVRSLYLLTWYERPGQAG